ncbi:DUF3592 domain-containing protein [Pedobacter foliorum]|uniref:DUF3592 domain-containing protein n=1 Tax=Pedobacter foliorum TaxID=2739058 RepID=UPI0015632AE8|nr:DUF3592 domain-containing protein [Pedobacter foliorum]NRF40095.1 DUF3592 domain-containing protein [Pedobacter foliorum]
MIIKNKKLIAAIALISGIGIAVFSAAEFCNYTAVAVTGIKTTGRITGYKRTSGAGKTHPAFSFILPNGDTINGISKTMSFRIVRKSYSLAEDIKVSYNSDDPSGAVILSWREWPGSLFVMLFGLLLVLIGWQMLYVKNQTI